MGDRVSIQYGKHWQDVSHEWLSATLKHHWGGPDFAKEALEFAKSLVSDKPWSTPTSRLDPDNVIVHFVAHLYKEGYPDSLRLVPNPEDCDNSDNGHFIIWLDTGEIERR